MRRISLLLVSLIVLTIQAALAQSFSVKGTVVSAGDNEPLIGVTILQEGTTNGVVTDFDGNFTIEVKGASKATLVISYIGMVTQKHSVNAQTKTLNVALASDTKVMDEVVVVAYGVRKKGTIAGSVSSVKSEKIENVPAASFDQALQGQSTGLQVISASGEPSKAATFQIRGTNSINSGKSPLFILDGVPISSSDFNTLSPNDIESISVLKDASSTSIYGARAANGVIVITSKRGLAMDKAKVTLRAQYGFSQLAQTNWKMMNTAERIQFEKEVGLDAGKDYNLLSRVNVNWLDEVFNDAAPLQNYELSINRATDRLNYYVSGGFYDQDGIAQNSTFRRYNMRANADVKASNWLKVGANTMAVYEEAQQADDGSYTTVTPISACRFMLPYWNPYASDGSLASLAAGNWAGTSENPIVYMDKNPIKNKKYKVLSTVYAEIYPIENLTIRTQFGADFNHSTAFMQSFQSFSSNNGQGLAARQSSDMLSLTETTTANYRFSLKDIHSFNVMLGQEAVNYHSEGFNVYSRGQNNDLLTNVSSGTRASRWSDSSSDYSYMSFFMRGEYNYKEKYFADFSLRTDASSRFGKDHRWGTFWSVGFMWNMKKTEMLEKYEWLTNAQLALSTGTSGNSEIPNYYHLALVNGDASYDNIAGLYPAQSGNEELGWESTWASNFALRLGFIDRINFSVEAYYKRTSNMLMRVPESYTVTGEGYRWKNVGVMSNQGIELSADGDVVRTDDFTWNVSANVSYNCNRLKELYNGVTEYVNSTTGLKYVVGHSVSEFYLNRYAGVNPANGEQLWYDKDGNVTNEFREGDKVMTGKTYDAPWMGGFGTSIRWKGLQLSAQFSWIGKRYVINNDRFFEESGVTFGTAYNQSNRLLYDRWKNPGDITDIPRWGEINQLDDRYLENASFLRMKNLSLSYSLPQRLLRKSNFFSSVRIFGQAQNLFTVTGFNGLDPEVSSNVYQAQYPASRQFTMGVEVSF